MLDLPSARETISQLSADLRAGHTTPLALVERCLTRIATFEPVIHAWVAVDAPAALATAQQLTDDARHGRWRGPLHGIPLGIKDIVDVAGFPTLAGSQLRSTAPLPRDATLVERLRNAGAIILGKTVTTEFACFDPAPTRNPWHLDHTPGGSSSGSAAAVALGMCVASIGSQTGGSISRPATYCGICGLKPTFGRVSVDGVAPVSFHLDHPGPMARSVADLAHLLTLIAGPDPRDPLAADVPPTDYSRGLAKPAQPPRLAQLEDFFLTEADAEMVQAFHEAIDQLRHAGAHITSAPLPTGFNQVHKQHRCIMAVEAAEVHCEQFRTHRAAFGPHVANLIQAGLDTSALDYSRALRHQINFRAAAHLLATRYDAIIVPATPAAAPDLSTTGDPSFNSPWSYAGLPTVSLPCSLTRSGLPLGLQLVGPRWSEPTLLSVAAWCETQLAFSHQPTLASAK